MQDVPMLDSVAVRDIKSGDEIFVSYKVGDHSETLEVCHRWGLVLACWLGFERRRLHPLSTWGQGQGEAASGAASCWLLVCPLPRACRRRPRLSPPAACSGLPPACFAAKCAHQCSDAVCGMRWLGRRHGRRGASTWKSGTASNAVAATAPLTSRATIFAPDAPHLMPACMHALGVAMIAKEEEEEERLQSRI